MVVSIRATTSGSKKHVSKVEGKLCRLESLNLKREAPSRSQAKGPPAVETWMDHLKKEKAGRWNRNDIHLVLVSGSKRTQLGKTKTTPRGV